MFLMVAASGLAFWIATGEAKRKYYEQGFNDGHKSAINKVWESQRAESPKYIIIKQNGFECIPPCEFPRDSLFFQLSSEKK